MTQADSPISGLGRMHGEERRVCHVAFDGSDRARGSDNSGLRERGLDRAGSVLLRDIADVKRLKQAGGPNLVTQGNTELVHTLLAEDLIDAMSIFTVPVVLGGGKKLFADGSAPHAYKLTGSRISSKGVAITHYARGGEIRSAKHEG